jgi:penicillin-binding protein 2
VPDEEWSQRQRGHQWFPGETISVAIGQGLLNTTPIQIAAWAPRRSPTAVGW